MTYRVLSAELHLAAGATAGPVLGLETGGAIASGGLVSNGRIVASISREAKSHGAGLPALVAELLEAAGLKFRDLSAVAIGVCLLYTSPSPRDRQKSRMPSSA